MAPRLVSASVRDLSVADAITVANAALGFLAALVATTDPGLAARLVLLAAVADGLDGVVAREFGSSAVGEYLDSAADLVSFGVAPGTFLFFALRGGWPPADPYVALAFGVGAWFVVASVLRTGIYTAYEEAADGRGGVQNTLASTIVAAGYLAGLQVPTLVAAAAVVLSVLMLTEVPYPKLAHRDALAMGVVQAGAILVPDAALHAFPLALLVAALAYLTLAPRYYDR